VQGVGFRPFVYQVAQSLGLTGYVFNSSSGLTIEIEGRDRDVSVFLNRLSVDPPQLAVVTDISVSDVEANGDSTFCILRSRDEVGAVGLVSPDLGICDACWRELGNPTNRRYGYPFTNCTHCGPRYTIINDIPYDRATTSMSAFTMCNACQAEYDDPNDRRFHAQPNASLATFRMARALLHEGKILAVKGLGGFLFACDATDGAHRVAALVGDLATENDAARLSRATPNVRQITTGTICHLDAQMIERALESWRLDEIDFLFIENVGNLVCPSSYDLGESLRFVLLSATEGEDKPLKYPTIFNSSDVAVITKMDMADAAEFDRSAARRNIESVRPGMQVFEVSSKTGFGMDRVLDFLNVQLALTRETQVEAPL
jgi:hydrogenase nickel incorporation protein HypB